MESDARSHSHPPTRAMRCARVSCCDQGALASASSSAASRAVLSLCTRRATRRWTLSRLRCRPSRPGECFSACARASRHAPRRTAAASCASPRLRATSAVRAAPAPRRKASARPARMPGPLSQPESRAAAPAHRRARCGHRLHREAAGEYPAQRATGPCPAERCPVFRTGCFAHCHPSSSIVAPAPGACSGEGARYVPPVGLRIVLAARFVPAGSPRRRAQSCRSPDEFCHSRPLCAPQTTIGAGRRLGAGPPAHHAGLR